MSAARSKSQPHKTSGANCKCRASAVFLTQQLKIRGPHLAHLDFRWFVEWLAELRKPVCLLECVCSFVSDSSQPHRLEPFRLLCPWNFPGRNIGVGCHFLFQEIFWTQGSNPLLFNSCIGKQIFFQLGYLGSPTTAVCIC